MASEDRATRDRILEEAARLFVLHGYHGLSMREIAEAVGVSKAGLYYYFADKEALFLAILTANLDHLGNLIRSAREECATARDQVRRMMHAIFQLSPDQRAIIRLATQEIGQLSPAAQSTFGQSYQEKFIQPVQAILRGGVARGEVKDANIPVITWILLGMAYPFFSPAHEPKLKLTGPEIDWMVDIFFDGAANRNG